ncbi:ribonuclease HI [Candidatus Peregrinibacteria bacterium]|mgnify:CR=1 FL=1|jgi:ribonuclease HI|nr:ribonuclease HI [Candidatus Peregrinibacteria bacterium]
MHTIYTDGSCIGNPGPGGWAFIVIDTESASDDGPMSSILHQESGSDPETTNNRMEMMALLRALEYAVTQSWQEVAVFSDSRLVVNTVNLGWKRKANLDLWIEMEKPLAKINLKLKWVKAHDQNIYNNMVDELALKAAKKA